MIQGNSAVRAMATFIVTIIHQTSIFVHVQGLIIRSSVMANDVLLHTAATTEKVPAIVMFSGRPVKRWLGGMSQTCFPYPFAMLTLVNTHSIISAPCQHQVSIAGHDEMVKGRGMLYPGAN